MKYILALDQDTTSSRAIVFDRAGRVKAVAQKGFPQIFPKPGWGEHDAGAIWKTQLATAKAALKKARLTAAHIAAIGITNQRCCGIAKPASPSPTPSCGRIAAPRRNAIASAPTAAPAPTTC